MVYKWLNNIQGWLLPNACSLCGQPGQKHLALCSECYKELKFLDNTCIQCSLPLANTHATIVCGQCLQQPPAYDRTFSLFTYQAPIKQLIQALKFRKKLAHARLLGSLLGLQIQQRSIDLPDCIVPVPLSTKRLRERGFNQSLELARPVSRVLAIPMQYRLLQRVRDTPPQSQLNMQERHRNIRQAFKTTLASIPKHIAIIDDVMTSGSTCHEVASTLKRAGAARVDVWCIARTVK